VGRGHVHDRPCGYGRVNGHVYSCHTLYLAEEVWATGEGCVSELEAAEGEAGIRYCSPAPLPPAPGPLALVLALGDRGHAVVLVRSRGCFSPRGR